MQMRRVCHSLHHVAMRGQTTAIGQRGPVQCKPATGPMKYAYGTECPVIHPRVSRGVYHGYLPWRGTGDCLGAPSSTPARGTTTYPPYHIACPSRSFGIGFVHVLASIPVYPVVYTTDICRVSRACTIFPFVHWTRGKSGGNSSMRNHSSIPRVH